jgi:hypothetical protein
MLVGRPLVFVSNTPLLDLTEIADKAIFINGSDKKLAAGGGIRALRYLKK